MRLYFASHLYLYLVSCSWCFRCLRWGIWGSGRSDQSFCPNTDIFFPPAPFPSFGGREIVLGKTRHTQFVSYNSRIRVVPRVDPHARGRSSMVVAPVRLPPRTRVTTLHTSLNRRIQSTEPSGATSSPSAQGRARRILEDAIRARGVVCVVFVVRSPAPRLPRGSLVAPGRERRGRRM